MFDAQAIAAQAQNESPQVDRGPMQPGWYKAKMANFDVNVNKSGTGEHLRVEFDLDNGRKVWNRYNLKNNNDTAERIALEQMAALCMACGYNSIQDPWSPVELMDKACELYIDVDGSYNNVKSVRKIEGQQDAAQKLYGASPAVAPSVTPNPDSGIVDSEIPF